MISIPIKVKPLENYKIWIEFEDGVNGELDLTFLQNKGVFKALNDHNVFKKIYIDVETKSVAWTKDIELDSNNLYLKLIGKTFEEWKSENIEYASNK
ncbi:MAG: DUF2442 domain-containing protein [bacterium]|nr:DUF2442 domain-containing protein [bacterium]